MSEQTKQTAEPEKDAVKKTRKKHEYPDNFKGYFGYCGMGLSSLLSSALVSSYFMMYLTDYAGLNSAWAAKLATVILLIGRIIDMVDDPVQGWIMDNGRITKVGKYKPFQILSIVMIAIACLGLFAIPDAFKDSEPLVVIWVLVFYLISDFGQSFDARNPLQQSMTLDTNVRSKMFFWERIVSILGGILFSFFMTIYAGMKAQGGDVSGSFTKTVVLYTIPFTVIALLSLFCVKENVPSSASGKEAAKKEDKVSFSQLFEIIKHNKVMQNVFLTTLVYGFIYTLMFATNSYYLKWTYASSNGVVDDAAFGAISPIFSAITMLAMLISVSLTPGLVKKWGPVKVMIRTSYAKAVLGLVLVLLQFTGILAKSAFLFMSVFGLMYFFQGFSTIPMSVLRTEAIDYNAWTTGKENGGMVVAGFKFLDKAQAAISTVLVGGLLILVDYAVEADGNLSANSVAHLGYMQNGLVVIMALIPAILSLLTVVCIRRYPLSDADRKTMVAELAQRRAKKE